MRNRDQYIKLSETDAMNAGLAVLDLITGLSLMSDYCASPESMIADIEKLESDLKSIKGYMLIVAEIDNEVDQAARSSIEQ